MVGGCCKEDQAAAAEQLMEGLDSIAYIDLVKNIQGCKRKLSLVRPHLSE